jgi:hypothetical protein
MGMLRVYATMKNSEYSNELRKEQRDLIFWVKEIQDAMFRRLDDTSSLFHNYASETDTFLDAAGTALLAASVYRIAMLADVYHNIPYAEKSRKAISSSNIQGDGWLTPVVDPYNVGREGERSPEGQAFVLMMNSAYEEWKEAGSEGVNAAGRIGGRTNLVLLGVSIAWAIFL